MTCSRYLIALGSNQRHTRFGRPRKIVARAMDHLARSGLMLAARSPIVNSRPIGPSRRQYANAAMIAESGLSPVELLRLLKQVEAEFGRRQGQAWSRRVLDLDIILWDQGTFVSDSPHLVIPHPLMRERGFVLGPAAKIAPRWRDPITGLRLTHLLHRLKRLRQA